MKVKEDRRRRRRWMNLRLSKHKRLPSADQERKADHCGFTTSLISHIIPPPPWLSLPYNSPSLICVTLSILTPLSLHDHHYLIITLNYEYNNLHHLPFYPSTTTIAIPPPCSFLHNNNNNNCLPHALFPSQERHYPLISFSLSAIHNY